MELDELDQALKIRGFLAWCKNHEFKGFCKNISLISYDVKTITFHVIQK